VTVVLYLQAIRKAPQHGAPGFRQTVQKLAVTVELLLGDIPERALFRQPMYKKALAPYFQLTQAVRTGMLPVFFITEFKLNCHALLRVML